MQNEKDTSLENSANIVQDQKILLMAVAPIGIVINLGMGLVTQCLKLPIYLDTIGTLLSTVLIGISGGIVTGVSSSLLAGLLINPVIPCYTGTQIAIAAFSGWMAEKGYFRSLFRVILTGILLGIVSAIVSAPVVAIFSGVTGTCTDVTMAFLLAQGKSLFESTFWANFANEPFDKVIQCLLMLWIIKSLPNTCKRHFTKLTLLNQMPKK